MGKKPEPPKEAGAPVYFVQYSALWCLMLAFFVVLLSMGHERTAAFKSGMGFIRDAFGLKGGLGMLQFWRKTTQGHGDNNPSVKKPKEEGDVIGFFKGMLWKEGLSSVTILQTRFDERGVSITLATPVKFEDESASLDRDSQQFLSRLGAVLFNVPEMVIGVYCMETAGEEEARSLLATERSAAITRYLQDEARLPANRLEAVGYAHQKYLTALGTNPVEQVVLFSLRKMHERKSDRPDVPSS